jgi:glycosyltransferase involved in cell wall biosynthesis
LVANSRSLNNLAVKAEVGLTGIVESDVLYSKVRMRFAIDAHAIGRRLTGNETYIRSLLREFAVLDRRAEWITYLCRGVSPHAVPQGMHVREVGSNPFRRLGYDIPQLVKADRPDLLHVQYTAPLFPSSPVVVSVHDVSFEEYPEFFSFARRKQLQLTVANTVKKAAKVLCPSEFSRQRVLERYQLPESKVVAIHNGVSHQFRPIHRDLAKTQAAQRLGFTQPFVLTVGDLRRRKNQVALIQAFAKLMKKERNLTHRLVLVGKDAEGEPVRRAAAESGLGDRIVFAGFVSDEELVSLYSACEAFVFPSLYEGFGLPIIEAMACGAPVACSNSSAMPEVADSCGLLFDPRSEEEIYRAMRDLVLDAELRSRMSRLGQHRATLFSWKEAAKQTLREYYEVVGQTIPGEFRSTESRVGEAHAAEARNGETRTTESLSPSAASIRL